MIDSAMHPADYDNAQIKRFNELQEAALMHLEIAQMLAVKAEFVQ